jgi:predicted GIY-YIG superfamily endonuclease
MSRVKFLYGILDPVTMITMYVGQTYHPQQRFREHIRGPLEVDDWMRQRISEGQSPVMTILDKRKRGANTRELQLISKAKKQNAFLLNKKGV